MLKRLAAGVFLCFSVIAAVPLTVSAGGTTNCSCPEVRCGSQTSPACSVTCTTPSHAACSCGSCNNYGYGYPQLTQNSCGCN